MLSILGLDDMHFANLMIQTPNSMSRKLPIDLRIVPQSTTIYIYPHACPLYAVAFSIEPVYRGDAIRVLGSATYTHSCLYEGMIVGPHKIQFGNLFQSRVSKVDERGTHMTASGANTLCHK